jgi:hypothetical protein
LGVVSAHYERVLDALGGVLLRVEFITDGREVVDYALVLIAMRQGDLVTARVYDGAHGVNEMHRYTRSGGKQPAVHFHAGTLGEGMRAAMVEIELRYRQMIEGWDR